MRTEVGTYFWRSAMLGSVGGAVLFSGIGLLTINIMVGILVSLCAAPLFYFSHKNNIKYVKLLEVTYR